MIREYTLSNFKAFGQPASVPIKPITLIYGENSSGKSSIIQSFLLLKQTIEDSENRDILLAPKGKFVDLGGFREFIFAHDLGRVFSVSFTQAMSQVQRDSPPWIGQALRVMGEDELTLCISFRYVQDSASAAIEKLDFFVGRSGIPLATFVPAPADGLRDHMRFGYGMMPDAVNKSFLKLASLDLNHPVWERFWNEQKQTLIPRILPELRTQIEFLERRLRHLTEMDSQGCEEDAAEKRPATARKKHKNRISEPQKELKEAKQEYEKWSNYTLEKAKESFATLNKGFVLGIANFLPCFVGSSAEPVWMKSAGPRARVAASESLGELAGIVLHTADAFRDQLRETIYIGPLRDYPERYYIFSGNVSDEVGKSGKLVADVLFKNKDLVSRVNERLRLFGLDYELRIPSISEEDAELQDVFALRLTDKRTGVSASILDVGFGISQVLPIIVQSMLSKNKLLCIEQPEIHLHPKLQADLATLMFECAQPPYSNMFIVETHSEHLVLRLQRLIREGKLPHENVSVVYIRRGEHGSECVPLRLDSDGDFIDEWPDGFFEEGFKEIFH